MNDHPAQPRLRFVGGLAVAVAAGLAAVGGFALHGTTPAVAQDAQVGQAGGVGVVDFTRIQTESKFIQQLQEQLRAATDAKNQELQREQAAIQQAVSDMQNNMAAGSPQRQEKERELAQRNAVLQFNQQAAQQDAGFALNQANRDFFDAAEKAVRDVAQARGLAVVIRKSSQEVPEDRARLVRIDPNDLRGLIQGQTTLYVDPGADITGEVIKKIDDANVAAN